MNNYMMKKHGTVLTGRDYGISVMKEITPYLEKGMVLNFLDVSSLGSSFGDEVVTPVAIFNDGEVDVLNANKSVKEALKDVEEDGEIKINFI